MLVVLGSVFLVIAMCGLIFFLRGFVERTKYLKREIARALTDSERKYWQHKLKQHRLSLLPWYRKDV